MFEVQSTQFELVVRDIFRVCIQEGFLCINNDEMKPYSVPCRGQINTSFSSESDIAAVEIHFDNEALKTTVIDSPMIRKLATRDEIVFPSCKSIKLIVQTKQVIS